MTKPGDVAMKRQAVVESSLGKGDEVLGRKGRVVLSELGDDDAFGGVEGGGAGHDMGFSFDDVAFVFGKNLTPE